MERDEFIQRSSLYALGALEGEELRQFEAYLATASAEEKALLGKLTATASLLPLALQQKAPHPRVKEQLLQKVALSSSAQATVRRRMATITPQDQRVKRGWVPWGIAAALAMTAAFALFVFQLLRVVDRQNTELAALQRENQQLQTRLASHQDELNRREEQLRVLSAKEIHISIMSGLQVNPVAYGKIIWDPERGSAILHVSNLPPVPTDKDYQLWIIKENRPISAGVFAVSDSASNFFKIENLAVTNPREIAAFAVTLEPKGGMLQPTGPMYLKGTPVL